MLNRKVSKIIGPVAGIMAFMIAIGAVSIPVYAAENVNSNYEINQNGVKLKVTDIAGTKHRIKVDAIIEREDGSIDLDHRNHNLNIYMENTKREGSSMSSHNDDNKIEISTENRSKEGFSETGNIRVDLVMGQYDFNGSLVIPVDFTESFKQVIEKDLNTEVSNDIKIIGFESDVLGTRIIVDEPVDKWGRPINFFNDSMRYIMKVDDKIYLMDSHGHNYDDNNYKIYELDNLKYDYIKDVKKISIIPLKCDLTTEEYEEYYENNSENCRNNKIINDNIKYNNEILFEDGTKGEIKVERTGEKIKLYCNSDSDKKSLLMAVEIDGIYMDGEDYCGHSDKPIIYKSTENENQYIVEFNNEHKDKTFEAFLEGIISNIDKFELGNEISVK